jgi:precorrin-3B synthase
VTILDACPGILDLHQARDGRVARVRVPGGYLTAADLRALASIARRFGDGRVDLTSRGNLQLRGVRAPDAAALSAAAAADGLLPSPAHDRARNIVAGPLAGLPGHPDLRPLVAALDAGLRADPALAALPGRFLFSLDDGTGRAAAGVADVAHRFSPDGGGGRAGGAGVALLVAGRETGVEVPAGDQHRAAALALAAARAFLEQRRGCPDATRVAALPDGGAAVAAAVGGHLAGPVADTATRLPLGPLPAPGPGAGVAAVPLGRLDAGHLDLLAGLVRAGEVVRLAAAGRVVLPVAGTAGAALPELAAAGLLVADDHPLSLVTACSGTACARSLADVRALARPLGDGLAVHWAGCGRRCGRPADAVPVVATAADRFLVGDDPAPRRLGALAAP